MCLLYLVISDEIVIDFWKSNQKSFDFSVDRGDNEPITIFSTQKYPPFFASVTRYDEIIL